MDHNSGMSFSKEQVREVLKQFVAFCQSEECRATLKKLAPDEDKMNQYIEDNQKIIFAKFGVNPEAGMKDLRKITLLWKEEKEIIQLLMFTATKEELVLQEALTSTSNLQQTEMQDNLIKVQFQQMQQQMDSLQNDPQQMLKVQMMMQQQISMMAPEQRQEFAKQLMESLPPQQREQIQKLQEQQQQQQTQTPKSLESQPSTQPTPIVMHSSQPSNTSASLPDQMQQQLDLMQQFGQQSSPVYGQPSVVPTQTNTNNSNPFEKR